MKNSRNLGYVKDKDGKKIPKLFKSKEVETWLAGIETSLLEQFKAQGSPQFGKGIPIAMWTDIVVPSSTIIPNKDGDNIQTTIQETLQKPPKPSGILGLVLDDKQVISHSVNVRTKPRLLSEFATVYAWEMKPPYIYLLDLAIFAQNFYIPKILNGAEYDVPAKDTAALSNMWLNIEGML